MDKNETGRPSRPPISALLVGSACGLGLTAAVRTGHALIALLVPPLVLIVLCFTAGLGWTGRRAAFAWDAGCTALASAIGLTIGHVLFAEDTTRIVGSLAVACVQLIFLLALGELADRFRIPVFLAARTDRPDEEAP